MSVIPQSMGANEVSNLIPHKNRMMLLDSVDCWDENSITCSAISHLKADNPLRVNGKLSYIHTIEYGAQAAAIHLAIITIALGKPMSGYTSIAPIKSAYLAITRNFSIEQGFLDDHPGSKLCLKSELLSVGPRIYQYKVTASINKQTVAEGTVSLVTDEIQE